MLLFLENSTIRVVHSVVMIMWMEAQAASIREETSFNRFVPHAEAVSNSQLIPILVHGRIQTIQPTATMPYLRFI